MKSVLDLIRDTFDEDLGPDLVHGIPQTSLSQLNNFKESYRDFTLNFRLPGKPPDEVRPFITPQASKWAYWIHGFPFRPGDFHAEHFDFFETGERQTTIIKHHLLYCHSLVLHDPLPYILDGVYPTRANRSTLEWLQNYLSFLCLIKPLVAGGLIYLLDEIPYKHLNPYGRSPSTPGLAAVIWPGTFPTWQEIEEIAERVDYSDIADARPPEPLYVHEALKSIDHTLLASSFHDGNLNMYFPASLFRDTLREAVERTNTSLERLGMDLTLLQRLLSVSVPRLSDLDIGDIVQIRNDEEGFDKWRNTLRAALQLVLGMDKSALVDPNAEAFKTISAQMHSATRELEEMIKKSTFLNKAKEGTSEFIIGALAMFAVTEFMPMDISTRLLTSGLRGFGKVIQSFVKHRIGASERALLNQYLLFRANKPV